MANERETRLVPLGTFKYSVMHLPGIKGFKMQARLLKILTPIFKAGSLSVQKEFLVKAAKMFISGEMELDEEKLKCMIGEEDLEKLKDLFGAKQTATELAMNLTHRLENSELVLEILQDAVKEVEASDSQDGENGMIKTIMEGIPEFAELLVDLMQSIDEEVLADFMEEIISCSVVRVTKPDNTEINFETGKKFDFGKLDALLAGKWHELLELTIFICLYNFAVPIFLLVKKNQIASWWTDFIGTKIQKEKEESEKNEEAA